MATTQAPLRGHRTEQHTPVAAAPGPVQLKGQGRAEDAEQIHQAARFGLRGASASLPFLDLIQRSFGHHDVSGIKVHSDGQAASAARFMGARAFATGNRIGLAGTPDLHTLAHEAAHVVQQRRGVAIPSGVGQANDRYERQADAVADLVVQGKSSQALLDGQASRAGASSRPAIQRDVEDPKQTPAGHFLVDDSGVLASGQVHKSDFLSALRDAVTKAAAEILAQIGETAQDCPYIPYWFELYEGKSAAHLERGIAKYAPGSEKAQSWNELVALVTARVREGLQANVDSGSLDGVPEELPRDLHLKQTKLEPVKSEPQGNVQLCLDEGDDNNAGTVRARTLRGANSNDKLDMLWAVESKAVKDRYQNNKQSYGDDYLEGCTGAAAAIGNYLLPGAKTQADNYGERKVTKLGTGLGPVSRGALAEFLGAGGDFFFKFKTHDPVASHEYVVVKTGQVFDLYESDTNPGEAIDRKNFLDAKRQGQNARRKTSVDELIAQLNDRLGKVRARGVNAAPGTFDYSISAARVPL